MYEKFKTKYQADSVTAAEADKSQGLAVMPNFPELSHLLNSLGGRSFNKGIYRLHTPSSAQKWTDIIEETFPSFKGALACFGYDWLGRQFALDNRRIVDGKAQVLLLDPGFEEALEVPATLESFHNSELVDYEEEALAKSFYDRWLALGGEKPNLMQCIGYRVPPTLGGQDEVENLELSDMEVYWGILGQLPSSNG